MIVLILTGFEAILGSFSCLNEICKGNTSLVNQMVIIGGG